MFYPFESIKNSITILFSSYFHIFWRKSETHIFLYLYFFYVFKYVLKHSIFQYYAMKLKNFFLLIIKIKNIHEFNVLKLNLWILSTKKIKYPSLAYFTIFYSKNFLCFYLGTNNSQNLLGNKNNIQKLCFMHLWRLKWIFFMLRWPLP